MRNGGKVGPRKPLRRGPGPSRYRYSGQAAKTARSPARALLGGKSFFLRCIGWLLDVLVISDLQSSMLAMLNQQRSPARRSKSGRAGPTERESSVSDIKKMPSNYLFTTENTPGAKSEECIDFSFELSLDLEGKGLVFGSPECDKRVKEFHAGVRRRIDMRN
jgi:hypothetical protein